MGYCRRAEFRLVRKSEDLETRKLSEKMVPSIMTDEENFT